MKVKLNPGEEICPNCKGSGEEPGEFIEGFKITCSRCWGDRKLDWIEMAMGKPFDVSMPFKADADGSVDLYLKGRKILETIESGIKVV
jgi:hypothetical protein